MNVIVFRVEHNAAVKTQGVSTHYAREPSIRSADLLDLPVFELNRRRPAKNGNGHFEPLALFVHFLDETVEGSERTIGDTHLLADLETD